MSAIGESSTVASTIVAALELGYSIIPIGPNKQPDFQLLPRDPETNKPTWKPFTFERADATWRDKWVNAKPPGLALVCGQISGGTNALDFDFPELYHAWNKSVGAMAAGLAVQQTGGGNYQAFFKCATTFTTQKLAWIPDDTQESGRKTGIEMKAERGYANLPPTLHPSGKLYAWLSGDLSTIPVITTAHANALIDAARKLDRCPKSKQEIAAEERAKISPTKTSTHRAKLNGEASVIDAYNEAHDVREVLRSQGYRDVGSRMIRPNADEDSQPGVSFFDRDGLEGCYCWSTNDMLNNGHWHSAFDVYCELVHLGDCAAAVKDLADKLGMKAKKKKRAENISRAIEPIVTSLANIPSKKVDWLWFGRFPLGRVTLIVGRPGEGKSFFTCYMSAVVSTGSPWPDGSPCAAGDVLLICGEDDPSDTIRPRCEAQGAALGRIHVFTMIRRKIEDGTTIETMFTLADVHALEMVLMANPQIRLVVVDPIGTFIGGKVDAHRDNEVRSVLAPFAKLAEKYNFAGVMVAHRRKASSDVADDLAMGSRAFTGLARAVWHLSRDPQNRARRLLLPGKNNLAAEGTGLAFTIIGDPPAISWEREPVAMSADDGLAAEQGGPGRPANERNEAADWLQSELADRQEHEVKALKAAAKAAGLAVRTVERAATELAVIRSHSQFGGAWTWRLPKMAESTRQNCGEISLTKEIWRGGEIAESSGELAIKNLPRLNSAFPRACAGARETGEL
jgi:hypothetical protein